MTTSARGRHLCEPSASLGGAALPWSVCNLPVLESSLADLIVSTSFLPLSIVPFIWVRRSDVSTSKHAVVRVSPSSFLRLVDEAFNSRV